MARIARSAEIGVNFYQSFDYIRKVGGKQQQARAHTCACARVCLAWGRRCSACIQKTQICAASVAVPAQRMTTVPAACSAQPVRVPVLFFSLLAAAQFTPKPVGSIEGMCSTLAKNAVDVRPGAPQDP